MFDEFDLFFTSHGSFGFIDDRGLSLTLSLDTLRNIDKEKLHEP